jgi:hypothetical protein
LTPPLDQRTFRSDHLSGQVVNFVTPARDPCRGFFSEQSSRAPAAQGWQQVSQARCAIFAVAAQQAGCLQLSTSITSDQDVTRMSRRSLMTTKLVQLVAIVAAALHLVPTGAHLFELPHKMALSSAEYMTVQQIYAGWELFGIVIAIALLAALANTILVRDEASCLSS